MAPQTVGLGWPAIREVLIKEILMSEVPLNGTARLACSPTVGLQAPPAGFTGIRD